MRSSRRWPELSQERASRRGTGCGKGGMGAGTESLRCVDSIAILHHPRFIFHRAVDPPLPWPSHPISSDKERRAKGGKYALRVGLKLGLSALPIIAL